MKYTRWIIYGICLLLLISFGYYESYYFQPISDKEPILETEQSMQTEFYLFDEDETVIVRLKDGVIFEKTEIPVSRLPEKIKEELAIGYCIRGKKELYEFLENYSS